MPRAYVGTSGWSYSSWDGRFYPDDVSDDERLPYLAKRLDACEVNGSFYNVPQPKAVEAWAERTPTRFRLSLKMWRGATHYKKLRDARKTTSRFLKAVDAVPTRQRGALLLQLPPNFHRDEERLDAFLGEVEDSAGGSAWKVAVEPRHESWLHKSVKDVLDDHRASLVVHDMEDKAAVKEPNGGAPFVYVRRHGPRGDYKESYDGRALSGDARRIRRWLDDGRSVYVFFNNDHRAHAPHDAEKLRGMLED